MPRAKKVANIKNEFLHARQPRKGIIDICSNGCCIFTIEVFFQNGRHCSNFEKKNLKFEIYFIFDIYFQKITDRHWSLRSGPYLVLIYLHTVHKIIGTYLLFRDCFNYMDINIKHSAVFFRMYT